MVKYFIELIFKQMFEKVGTFANNVFHPTRKDLVGVNKKRPTILFTFEYRYFHTKSPSLEHHVRTKIKGLGGS